MFFILMNFIGPDGEIVNSSVSGNRDGSYQVQFKPASHGKHEISVMIDSDQLENSPFTFDPSEIKKVKKSREPAASSESSCE